MVGVMNPLGWAFAGPLILDPPVRWLALSPAREAPVGILFVGSCKELGRDGATSTGNRENFRDEARGTRKESVVLMLGADRAEATSSASSSTTTRCSAAQSFMVIWLMAGGAPLAPPAIKPCEPTSHAGASGQRAASGRMRIIKAGVGVGVGVGMPAISGGEPYSAVTFEWAGDGVTPKREEIKRSSPTVSPYRSITPSAERRRCGRSAEAADFTTTARGQRAETK